MTLRIGILGAARVATYAMIGAAKEVEGVIVQAVAARDPQRASAYAAAHAIPTIYPDYQTLIEADDIDAVYVALPPNLHAHWSIAALMAGKPVLCEKPFALCAADVEAMLEAEARSGLLLMEAQHSFYHPINVRTREIVSSGALGTIRHAVACFNADIERTPTEIRWQAGVGGGALWDLGVYPLWWLCSAIGETPEVVSAHQRLADTAADISTEAELRFPSVPSAKIKTDMTSRRDAWMRIEGERATLQVDNPLSATFPQMIRLIRDGKETVETFTRRKSFAFQLEVFRDALREGSPVPTRGTASLEIIQLCEKICAIATKE
jgi:predicted dehydrogenase